MLLRRIKTHIANENWFSVMIDFVIVVIGVFMGIQVQAYYQEQSDQRQMQSYLQRLHEDVTLSLTETERTRDFVSNNLENLGVVINDLRDCAVEEGQRDQFANGLFHVGKLIPESFVDGTLVELRASGRLLLLENEELRDAINGMVREHEYLDRVWASVQERAHAYRDYVDSKIIFLLDRPVSGFSNIEWSEIDIEIDQVCRDREFMARLSGLQRLGNINVDWLDRMLRRFAEVQELLEQEVGP